MYYTIHTSYSRHLKREEGTQRIMQKQSNRIQELVPLTVSKIVLHQSSVALIVTLPLFRLLLHGTAPRHNGVTCLKMNWPVLLHTSRTTYIISTTDWQGGEVWRTLLTLWLEVGVYTLVCSPDGPARQICQSCCWHHLAMASFKKSEAE